MLEKPLLKCVKLVLKVNYKNIDSDQVPLIGRKMRLTFSRISSLTLKKIDTLFSCWWWIIKQQFPNSIHLPSSKTFLPFIKKIFRCFHKIGKFLFYQDKNSNSKKCFRLIAQIILYFLFKTNTYLQYEYRIHWR